MSKVMFWLTVILVAIVGIYGFKALAGMSGSEGLQHFASSI